MKKLLIGFLLVTEHADPRRDCACIENEDAVLLFFTVNSYAQGEQYAKVLAALSCARASAMRASPAFKRPSGRAHRWVWCVSTFIPRWITALATVSLTAGPESAAAVPHKQSPQDADNPICILWGFFFPRFNQYRLRTSRYCTMASHTPSKPSTALLSVRS